MRLWRTAVLLGLGLLWFLLGPLVPLLALASLAHPRVRRAWRPTPRVVAGWALAAVVLTGLVVVAPDGLLPLPSGSGALVTPGYTGRPVTAQPLSVVAPDAGTANGPLGLSPEVDSALYGTDQCGGLVFTSGGRLVALCGEGDDQRLRVVDADTLRPLAGKDLPDPPAEAGTEACEVSFHLDGLDRVVVPTADRRILVVATADGAGEADLTTEETHDLTGVVPEGDCLLAVRPDSDDRTWFVTRQGRAGFVDPLGGPPRLLELGEEVDQPLATGPDGGVYVVTQAALHRLDVRRGEPVATWRSAYERGSGRKPGQRSQGSGSPAAVLAEPRLAPGPATTPAGPGARGRPGPRRRGGARVRARLDLPGRRALRHARARAGLGAALRLDQAPQLVGRRRVVPLRPRRAHRPARLLRAHRPQPPARHAPLGAHPRPRRRGVRRHPGRARPGARRAALMIGQGYRMPVTSSLTSHSRRWATSSWARCREVTTCGAPDISPRPPGPQ